MNAYEFEAEIKEGIIKIPDEFRGNRTGRFRIVIVSEETEQHKRRKALLNAPVWDDADVRDFHHIIQKGYENWIPEAF